MTDSTKIIIKKTAKIAGIVALYIYFCGSVALFGLCIDAEKI